MDHVISLNSPDLDWELLAQTVERAHEPLWLEVGGMIRGVLLPADAARRLMGRYVQRHATQTLDPPEDDSAPAE